MPRRALTDVDISLKIKQLSVPYFRGVFCIDKLPRKPHTNEIAIVNLDLCSNPGTHWVAYVKKAENVYYYDSFGNLRPPLELKNYFHGCNIFYNYKRDQNFNTFNCGHLCLLFIVNKVIEFYY